ncbi:hypothetical protein ACQJBY_056523 [Aegilops geniculata]
MFQNILFCWKDLLGFSFIGSEWSPRSKITCLFLLIHKCDHLHSGQDLVTSMPRSLERALRATAAVQYRTRNLPDETD